MLVVVAVGVIEKSQYLAGVNELLREYQFKYENQLAWDWEIVSGLSLIHI